MDNRILEIYQKLEEIKDLLDDVIQSHDHVARVLLKKGFDVVRAGIAQDVFQFFCRFLFQDISPFAENVI